MTDVRSYRILGLMSGSSLDGLDIAYCEFSLAPTGDLLSWELLQCSTLPYTNEWIEVLSQLPTATGYDLARSDAAFGRYLGKLTAEFIRVNSLSPSFIASHGHTTLHDPGQGFTLQVGDGSAIAAVTGIPVISQFRQMDLAYGGQGAPLAPLADRMLMGEADFYLNLGGIANISARTGERFVAFDITGANQILNALAATIGLEYDDGGNIARRGKPDPLLLHKASQLPYFQQPYPKSLGNKWVREKQIDQFIAAPGSVSDKLHTAVLLIAGQVAAALESVLSQERFDKSHFQMLITGGGAFNDFLVERIRLACQSRASLSVTVPGPKLVAFKEAALIALMGALRLEERPNCIASVTGATKNAVGGVIHLP